MRTRDSKEQSQGLTQKWPILQTQLSELMNAGIPLTPHLHGENRTRGLELEKSTGKSQRQHPPKAGFAHRAGGFGAGKGGWVPGGTEDLHFP